MKVLLYFEGQEAIKTSGIGRALSHQIRALESQGIEYTLNPKDDFDIAHINTLWAKSGAVLKRCKKKGIPVIVHGHSTFEDFRKSFKAWQLVAPFYNSRIRRMYSRADLVITPSPYSKGLIEGYGFVKKVIDISNGIDLQEYAENLDAQKAFREKFGIKEGEKFVMGVGFPFERKGIQDFFEVARSFPDVKFIWFGALQKILTNHKVKVWVKNRPANAIMAGYCKGDLIHGAYQQATCLFFPSLEETEGIVVLEALASHCPLVVRNIGVYEPWLKDGVNAHIEKDNKGFIKTIDSLLKNGEDKAILDEGYKVVEARTLEIVGGKLKEAYESLLK
ncbi:MAG: glycosyltransferase family 4 protein [Bacilli bacterium]|nr:glycosyltransferase family 4 protein [Bacilli bacterium]MBR6866256.1 glycosyltransferase family 4 protein [Bacilli bacterium]